MTLGICVLACRPVNASRRSRSGSRTARCEKRSARRRKRASPVMAATSARISFMPPCSARIMSCSCASLSGSSSVSAQAPRSISITRASASPVRIHASRSPAKVLCRLYQGTQRPLTEKLSTFRLAARDLAPGELAVGDPAEVAVAVGEPAVPQGGQHLPQAGAHRVVARAGGHHRQGRHVVPAHVAVQPAALPVAVGRLGQRQAGLAAEGREQPVRIERHQVAQVGALRVEAGPVEQTHPGQRKAGDHVGSQPDQDSSATGRRARRRTRPPTARRRPARRPSRPRAAAVPHRHRRRKSRRISRAPVSRPCARPTATRRRSTAP